MQTDKGYRLNKRKCQDRAERLTALANAKWPAPKTEKFVIVSKASRLEANALYVERRTAGIIAQKRER